MENEVCPVCNGASSKYQPVGPYVICHGCDNYMRPPEEKPRPTILSRPTIKPEASERNSTPPKTPGRLTETPDLTRAREAEERRRGVIRVQKQNDYQTFDAIQRSMKAFAIADTVPTFGCES